MAAFLTPGQLKYQNPWGGQGARSPTGATGPQAQQDWFTANAPTPSPYASSGNPTPPSGGSTVVDPNTLTLGNADNGGTTTGKYSTDPGSLIGAFSGAGSNTAEAYLKQILSSGVRGQQAADMVNEKFPNAVNWRQDRNFFDFPGSNSYVHQTDQGGWAGPWDLVQRGPEGAGGNTVDPSVLAALSGIKPFDYTGGGQQTFNPTTQAFVPTTFVAPDKKPEPGQFVAPTLSETNDPGYKFRLDSTMDAVQSAAAARGTLLTTGTLADVTGGVGEQASAEYANVYDRAFKEQQNAYSQWLTSDQNTFGQALQTNQSNNTFGLNANINAFNQEYQTTQLRNAAQATDFAQQQQKHDTNFGDLFKMATLGYQATNSSFT